MLPGAARPCFECVPAFSESALCGPEGVVAVDVVTRYSQLVIMGTRQIPSDCSSCTALPFGKIYMNMSMACACTCRCWFYLSLDLCKVL